VPTLLPTSAPSPLPTTYDTVAMRVLMVADVASTNDITEAILAQALVGKFAGADASSSSTIRNLDVIVVGTGSPTSNGHGNGPATNDAGGNVNIGTLSYAQSISSRTSEGAIFISTAEPLVQPDTTLKQSRLRNTHSPSARAPLQMSTDVLRSSRISNTC